MKRWRFVPFYVFLLGVTVYACFAFPTGSGTWWVAVGLLVVQAMLVVAQLVDDEVFPSRRRTSREDGQT